MVALRSFYNLIERSTLRIVPVISEKAYNLGSNPT